MVTNAFVREVFAADEQSSPVGPGGVDPAAAAALLLPDHPAPHLGLSRFDDRGVRGRPRHPERVRHLSDRAARISDRSGDRMPQPALRRNSQISGRGSPMHAGLVIGSPMMRRSQRFSVPLS
jgi:hypothetical protein